MSSMHVTEEKETKNVTASSKKKYKVLVCWAGKRWLETRPAVDQIVGLGDR